MVSYKANGASDDNFMSQDSCKNTKKHNAEFQTATAREISSTNTVNDLYRENKLGEI